MNIKTTKFLIKKIYHEINYLNEKRSVDNIFHASVQKTGSQWIKAVLNDPRIRKKTGLIVYPQHRYEWDEFQKKFPRKTFVPGLYLSYQSYEEIVKPNNYKTIYVYRDPRDLIVSWYYSMKYSHGLMGKVYKHRSNLEKLNDEDGISYCIKHFQLKLSFMKDWFLNCKDENVIFVKFEDLTANPVNEFSAIFERCNIEITESELKRVLGNYTKEKMRERNKKNGGKVSHYRKGGKSWEELFTEKHHSLFKRVNGDIVNLLGYKE